MPKGASTPRRRARDAMVFLGPDQCYETEPTSQQRFYRLSGVLSRALSPLMFSATRSAFIGRSLPTLLTLEESGDPELLACKLDERWHYPAWDHTTGRSEGGWTAREQSGHPSCKMSGVRCCLEQVLSGDRPSALLRPHGRSALVCDRDGDRSEEDLDTIFKAPGCCRALS